jgi:hypothetical protein
MHRILTDADQLREPRDFDLGIACGVGIEEALETGMALGPTNRALQDQARKRVPRWPPRCAARCNRINAEGKLR